jgi:hypothetical protein
VHGNPVTGAVIASVREYAEFLSSSALRFGLEAYVEGERLADVLARESGELVAARAGLDVATYWRTHHAGADSAVD